MKKILSFENSLFQKSKERIIAEKLHLFVKDGKDKLHLLLDFDRTLTKSKNKLGENVSTWEILKAHLPKKAQKEYQEFYKKYRTLEIKNQITMNDAVIWWEEILNLFKRNKLKWSDIAKDVEERMPIRPYTRKLFEICGRKNIPTIIISAGIKDVIELWCQKFEVNPTLILSTNLTFSSEEYMNGWHKDSLIHVLNKEEKGHREIKKIKLDRPNTILIGDSTDDASMINGEENVLRIALCNSSKNDKVNDKVIKEFFKRFDLIIQDGTLHPVIKILNLF